MKKKLLNNSFTWGAAKFKQYFFILTLTGFLCLSCTPGAEKEEAVLPGAVTMCGTVQFADGCGEKPDSLISYGLALVHHMTYDEAEFIFDRVIKESPDCFWGHWGKALTFFHPVWPDTPGEEQLKLGKKLSEKALRLATKEKEKVYGNALAAFYRGELIKTKQERLKSFSRSLDTAFSNYPDDMELKAFFALSLIATADPADKTFKNQLKAGALAEEVLKVIPDHPGGFHYAIHAYDNPVLVKKAMEVANNYGKIAPELPHALHMPSHIYTRLGMWNESVDWNTRSAEAAIKNPVKGAVSHHHFHALDYLVYAHLQKMEDKKALKILKELKKTKQPFQISFISAYALSALESRYFMERQDWDGASKLEVRQYLNLNWDQFPETKAITYFAKGLGGARSGNPAVADAAIKKLEKLQNAITNPYWMKQIEIQKNIVKAWLAYARGDKAEALTAMELAVALEASTEKHPVTPGELLPAIELLGDLQLMLRKPEKALTHYETALERSPGRLNSLFGAAYAAELSGNQDKAKEYYEILVNQSAGAEMLNKKENWHWLTLQKAPFKMPVKEM